jgi:3-hydroxyacyl-[acyl-carrier-protein] dehydratase
MLMNKLYHITSFEPDMTKGNIIALIHLNRNHPVFEGHFPGNPILPGVCTVQISKEILEKATNKELMLMRAGNIKYLGFVNPDLDQEMHFNLVVMTSETGELTCSSTVSVDGNIICSFKGEYRERLFNP